MLIVQKFGGSSLAGPEAVERSAEIIARAAGRGDMVAAVLSAQGDATDELVSAAALYSANPSPRELDMLLSTGEQASVALMAMALAEKGIHAVSLTGWQAGMETDAVFGAARLRRVDPVRVRRELERGRTALVAGFQGVTRSGEITTLGRGGSDTTAVALAAALGADECLIYTDVEGVCTADPRLVKKARRLERIDYGEMRLLAALGARVLHRRSAELAERFRVPLRVLSSMEEGPGTVVTSLPAAPEEGRLTAVTAQGCLVSLVGSGLQRMTPSPAARALAALEREGAAPEGMLETDGYLSVKVDPERVTEAVRCLHREFFETDGE